MKKWTGLVFALIAITLVAYYAMGTVVKRTLNKTMEAFPNSKFLQVKLENYHRGWFSSTADLSINMHVPEQESRDANGQITKTPATEVGLDFPLSIHHGPFILSDYGVLFGLGKVTTVPPTHYGVFVSYANKILMKYTMPAFSLEGKIGNDAGKFKVNWQGLATKFAMTCSMDNLQGSMQMYGLNGSADSFDFGLEGVDNEFNLNKAPEGIWVGKTKFLIPSIQVNSQSKPLFSLDQLALVLDSGVEEGMLNFDVKFSLLNLLVNQKKYGPVNLRFKLSNLDAASMAKINQIQMDMIVNQENNPLQLMAMMGEIPKLLSQGPELNFSGSIDVPEGKIISKISFNLGKSKALNLENLGQQIKGKGWVRMPQTLVKSMLLAAEKNKLAQQPQNPDEVLVVDKDAQASQNTEALLKKLVDQGVLKAKDQEYLFEFSIENSQFLVNGKPFNLQDFK